MSEEQVLEDAPKDTILYMGIMLEELDENKWLLESLDHQQQYLVFMDEEVTYEEGVATELLQGNIVMIEALVEDKETYRVFRILANSKDEIITLDPRESQEE